MTRPEGAWPFSVTPARHERSVASMAKPAFPHTPANIRAIFFSITKKTSERAPTHVPVPESPSDPASRVRTPCLCGRKNSLLPHTHETCTLQPVHAPVRVLACTAAVEYARILVTSRTPETPDFTSTVRARTPPLAWAHPVKQALKKLDDPLHARAVSF